jgi:hypothetical protein
MIVPLKVQLERGHPGRVIPSRRPAPAAAVLDTAADEGLGFRRLRIHGADDDLRGN